MKYLLVAVLLAGCLSASPPTEPPGTQGLDGAEVEIREPLPEETSRGGQQIAEVAINDTTGQVPPSPWARECVRHWQSAGYLYNQPPVILGRPCLFMATEEGTMFWHLVDFTGSARFGVPAAPIERPDGFYDWAVFDQPDYFEPGGVLSLYLNGTSEPAATWGEIPADNRNGMSATRLSDGSIHVLMRGWHYDSGVGIGTIYHAWLPEGGQPQWEEYPQGSVFNDVTMRVGPSGALAVGALTPSLLSNTVYLTRGAEFELLPPVPGSLFDVVEADGAIHACISIGSVYMHAWMPISDDASPPVWLYEPITTALLAQIAFTCDITHSSEGLVVVIDSPAPIGGGPNPLEGSHAFTQRGLGDWQGVPIGFSYHSGDDLVTTAGVPIHIGSTGSGTTNGEPSCGMALRAPIDGQWQQVFCNHHGDWSYGVDTPARPTIVANALLNPPFSTWTAIDRDGTIAMTDVVLVLPPSVLAA